MHRIASRPWRQGVGACTCSMSWQLQSQTNRPHTHAHSVLDLHQNSSDDPAHAPQDPASTKRIPKTKIEARRAASMEILHTPFMQVFDSDFIDSECARVHHAHSHDFCHSCQLVAFGDGTTMMRAAGRWLHWECTCGRCHYVWIDFS
jgi:hypothetical protein